MTTHEQNAELGNHIRVLLTRNKMVDRKGEGDISCYRTSPRTAKMF
jgi:hypothetical protein